MHLGERRPLPHLIGVFLIAGVALAGSVGLPPQAPPTRPLVIYLEDGPYVVTPLERNGVGYLRLVELLGELALPYTDATATGLFTIRGRAATLTLSRDSGSVSVDQTPMELTEPVLNEDGRWLVPVEFVESALARATGIGFTTTPMRIIADNVKSTPLEMEAASTDGITRLIIRLDESSNVRVQQDRERNLVTLNIDRAPLTPQLEALTYRDGSVRSVSFDDSDGRSRVVVETTPQVANVRLVPSNENRTFLLEFVLAAAPVEAVTVAPAPATGASTPDGIETTRLAPLRVLVIDAGHGGLDSGTSRHGVLEKDVSLVLARRLGATLEDRLDATIILTRDRDRALDLEDRAVIANQSRADLLISLHVGLSRDETESGGTVFVMKSLQPAPRRGGLFVPWYEAHLVGREGSRLFAQTLVERLSAQIPEWPFRAREAPLGVLASVATSAVVVELGNANNEDDLMRLADAAFQNRLIDAIVASVQAVGVRPTLQGAE